MTSNSGARGFLSGRRGPLIGAVVVTALVVLVAFSWFGMSSVGMLGTKYA